MAILDERTIRPSLERAFPARAGMLLAEIARWQWRWHGVTPSVCSFCGGDARSRRTATLCATCAERAWMILREELVGAAVAPEMAQAEAERALVDEPEIRAALAMARAGATMAPISRDAECSACAAKMLAVNVRDGRLCKACLQSAYESTAYLDASVLVAWGFRLAKDPMPDEDWFQRWAESAGVIAPGGSFLDDLRAERESGCTIVHAGFTETPSQSTWLVVAKPSVQIASVMMGRPAIDLRIDPSWDPRLRAFRAALALPEPEEPPSWILACRNT